LANPLQPTIGDDSWDAFMTVFAPDGSVVYSTYLGGNDYDYGNDIAVDSNGQAYLTGPTRSSNFPVVNAYQPTINGGFSDAFVTVFAPDGQSLVYSSFLGGSLNENGASIALYENGRVYLTGYTHSMDFPLANPFQAGNNSDTAAFVTIFAPDGQSLDFSTYLGGSSLDSAAAIQLDNNGRVYNTGITQSLDFPLSNPYQSMILGNSDVFVTVFAPDGQSLVYSTYLGGDSWEQSADIAVDGSGQAYVTGWTESLNFPLANPYQPASSGYPPYDAFLTAFAPDGQSLFYSTYLGGDSYDRATGIALDGQGRAYLGGTTGSSDFPVVNPLQTYGFSVDAFVSVFAQDGQSLDYSTYLRGGYPGGPTSVELTAFGDQAGKMASWLWLLVGLAVVFGIGIVLVRLRLGHFPKG
jgi:hypothetical protein